MIPYRSPYRRYFLKTVAVERKMRLKSLLNHYTARIKPINRLKNAASGTSEVKLRYLYIFVTDMFNKLIIEAPLIPDEEGFTGVYKGANKIMKRAIANKKLQKHLH